MIAPLHIHFVCYYSMACNSGAQIHSLANHLARCGHEVTVFVPFDADATVESGECRFRTRLFTDGDDLICQLAATPGARERSLLHVWTTRENVRQFTLPIVRQLGLRYIVHLEDNEPLITATNTGVDFAELARRPAAEVARIVGERLTSPHHFREFLAGAAGVTGLIDRLMEFAPPAARQLVFWPGFNEELFQVAPRNDALRRQHGIAESELCLVYAGNIATVNCAEVRSLYLAVAVLNRLGLPARLVRAGEDYATLFPTPLVEVESRVINLGRRPHREVPALYAMADFLVQPGHADPFNDYRFPSKLPEFFAMGRPVLLPPTNLGRFVRDGTDAVILREGHGLEIGEQIARLVREPALARRLATNAAAFAQAHFQWSAIAARIEAFYRDVLR